MILGLLFSDFRKICTDQLWFVSNLNHWDSLNTRKKSQNIVDQHWHTRTPLQWILHKNCHTLLDSWNQVLPLTLVNWCIPFYLSYLHDKLFGIYQYWVHQNPGTHPDGGIEEDGKWEQRRKNIYFCPPNDMTNCLAGWVSGLLRILRRRLAEFGIDSGTWRGQSFSDGYFAARPPGIWYNNNNNNNNHYHKRLGACLIPNGSVYIESRMNCCALFTRLNSSTASSDVMPVNSGSCLSGWSRRAKNLYHTFTSRLVTPGSNSKTRSESVNWLSILFT